MCSIRRGWGWFTWTDGFRSVDDEEIGTEYQLLTTDEAMKESKASPFMRSGGLDSIC